MSYVLPLDALIKLEGFTTSERNSVGQNMAHPLEIHDRPVTGHSKAKARETAAFTDDVKLLFKIDVVEWHMQLRLVVRCALGNIRHIQSDFPTALAGSCALEMDFLDTELFGQLMRVPVDCVS